jgi:hypothetical protein
MQQAVKLYAQMSPNRGFNANMRSCVLLELNCPPLPLARQDTPQPHRNLQQYMKHPSGNTCFEKTSHERDENRGVQIAVSRVPRADLSRKRGGGRTGDSVHDGEDGLKQLGVEDLMVCAACTVPPWGLHVSYLVVTYADLLVAP